MSSLYRRITTSDWFVDYGTQFCFNVSALCRPLKRGEHFVVRKGKLEITKSLCYFFTRRKEEAAVKSLITDTVVKLKGNDKTFQRLFFKRLALLPHEIFDRKATITPENFLEKKGSKIERRVQKAVLALKLGVALKPISKGTSGSYFARDYKGKVLGVFKPGSEEPLGGNSPKLLPRIRHFFLKTLFGIDTSLPFWPKEGYLAEVMSYKLAAAFGIKTLPPTQVAELQGKKGSFQLFVKNTKDLKRLPIKQEQFEQMAMLDMAISNRDRHFDNILMKDKDVVLIDHGLSFPRVNPPKSDRLYARNQYKWALLSNSVHRFSAEMIQKAKIHFRGEGLRRLLEEFKEVNNFHGKGFSSKTEEGSSQEYAFKERIAVLLIGMKKKMTIRQMARIKSKEDIRDFLHPYGIRNETELNQFLGVL